ncbi:uncharacterized protein LOC143905578 [Temnothorax americanus]|uniref:uncharacterized protein LOC143905578 n=1 Tax=Temnothorax americanus TaxID=1964332 RepID=UPI004067C8A2
MVLLEELETLPDINEADPTTPNTQNQTCECEILDGSPQQSQTLIDVPIPKKSSVMDIPSTDCSSNKKKKSRVGTKAVKKIKKLTALAQTERFPRHFLIEAEPSRISEDVFST